MVLGGGVESGLQHNFTGFMWPPSPRQNSPKHVNPCDAAQSLLMLGRYLESWDVTLLWCLQDGGDPAVDVSPRDIVYTLPADSASSSKGPQQLAQTDLRYTDSSRIELILGPSHMLPKHAAYTWLP